MMSRSLPIVLLVGLVGCGGSSDNGGPGPSPTPTPTPTTFTLSGSVTNASTGAGIGGATVTVVDGANSGKSATTDSGGSFSIGALSVGGFTVRARAPFYEENSTGVTLTADRSVSLALRPIPPFSRSGTGDNVFDMPRNVRRVRIQGRYTGFAQNFIVYIAGDLTVNELLGTGFDKTTFDGTYTTTGGVTEIRSSSGVQWTFTEVR